MVYSGEVGGIVDLKYTVNKFVLIYLGKIVRKNE